MFRIRFTKKIEVPAPASTADNRLRQFLADNHYLYRGLQGSALLFQKGDALVNMVTIDPQSSLSYVEAEIEAVSETSSVVTLKVNIPNGGQLFTVWDRAYWLVKMRELERALVEGAHDQSAIARAARTGSIKTGILATFALLGGLALVILLILNGKPAWLVYILVVPAILLTMLPFKAWRVY